MSKVLVDRELLGRVATLLEWDGTDETTPLEFGAKCDSLCKELRAILAQPEDPEGFEIARHSKRLVEHLRAELSAVTAERDRLESMLIRTTTRHFAQQWKDRADDKKLDECLSEVIAMLEAERDRLRAVLEGAQYPNIDRLKTLTIEQCRQVGETVMRLTIDAQSERDRLRAEVERLRKDAERYRWLRMADWWRSPLCVIRNPKEQAKPGSDCPSRTRLDEAVDAAMAAKEA